MDKTHFKKAFKSPYLSSADIVSDTMLTVRNVILEPDKTKRTKDSFNTAYFVETEIRPGEKLKPMILNVTNSKTLFKITGSAFIEDWKNVPVTVYVDKNVKMMGDTVEGLRIKKGVKRKRPTVGPGTKNWENAAAAYLREGNFDSVLKHADISEENKLKIIQECAK